MWQIKVLIQLILSVIPGGVYLNQKLQGVNRKSNAYSAELMKSRIPSLCESMKKIDDLSNINGATIMEIGPGGSMISALLFYLLGAKKVYAFDHLNQIKYKLLEKNINIMGQCLEEISKIHNIDLEVLRDRVEHISSASNLSEALNNASIDYCAPGDAAETKLNASSVDIIYSHAVFEHLPVDLINEITIESKRILKPTGIAYHSIDVHDHYAFDTSITKVNFLKYSPNFWSFFNHNKLAYHNRLRAKQFKDMFESLGSNTLLYEVKIEQESLEAVQQMKIDKHFSGMTFEELAAHQVELIIEF